MEEGTIRFQKESFGIYRIYSDSLTGEMKFVGYVEKNDRPMLNDRWYGRIPGICRKFVGATRIDVAEKMVRS